MPIHSRTLIPLLSVAVLAACSSSTTFTSVWKAPDAQAVSLSGKTVVAVFQSANESQRRNAEDLLASDLTTRGARGIAAYRLLANESGTDGDTAEARFKAAGADGAVIMRIVGKDQQVTYTPGSTMPMYYDRFGPYYGYGWRTASQPGYLKTDTLVSVETQVYSLKSGKLIWASTTRTTNPDNVSRLIQEAAEATVQEMAKQGFLAP